MNQVVLLTTLIVTISIIVAFILFLYTLLYATRAEETVKEREAS